MLGELTREEETYGGLDLTRGECMLLVVVNKARALSGDLLEDIVDERVHDAHGTLGDAGLGVDLLEDAVDVDVESLDSPLLVGLLDRMDGGARSSISGSFAGGFLGHFDVYFVLSYKNDSQVYSFKGHLCAHNSIKVSICNLTG